MPFTLDQFLGIFVAYNAAIWPAQIIAYAFGLIMIVAIWLQWPLTSRLILSILALMWAWNGIAYQFLWFASINPAAPYFAGIFVCEALLLAGCALAERGASFRIGRDPRSIVGIGFLAYAMLLYPLLGTLAGHGLMAGPMFGVAPCPTTIFTIGMLLLARGRWVALLSVIPLLWSLVGLAAALQLGMPEDLGLPLAGTALLIVLVHDALRPRAAIRRDGKLRHGR